MPGGFLKIFFVTATWCSRVQMGVDKYRGGKKSFGHELAECGSV